MLEVVEKSDFLIQLLIFSEVHYSFAMSTVGYRPNVIKIFWIEKKFFCDFFFEKKVLQKFFKNSKNYEFFQKNFFFAETVVFRLVQEKRIVSAGYW